MKTPALDRDPLPVPREAPAKSVRQERVRRGGERFAV